MLEHLSIQSLGVIASSDITLGPGFNAVTGETGAGKTMVVSALNLLLGARADASVVRRGDSAARVQADVTVSSATPHEQHVVELVEDAGGYLDEAEEGLHALTVSRTVSDSGSGRRSRATAGGSTVPVSLLGQIGGRLVVIHGQSEQLRLKSATAQREALDAFAGKEFAQTLEAYRSDYRTWRQIQADLAELIDQSQQRALEAENLQRSLEEIDEAQLRDGEDEELLASIQRLENVEGLREGALTARAALSGADDTDLNEPSAERLVEAARQALAQSPDDPELHRLTETLTGLGIQLSEAATDLASYAASLDDDGPQALTEAQNRRAELDRLKKLYGPELADVIAWAEQNRPRLEELQGDTGRREELTAQEAELAQKVADGAARLTALRTQAGESLSEQVTEELHGLMMPTAQFLVGIDPLDEPGPHGADDITLLLQPHPGSDPRPLGKGASGGELSRIMLALEVVLAATDPVPTFVFDEIDSGVGGEAAVQIGQRLARLAQNVQVIVVTHLPQVAAWADHHLRVTKNPDTEAGFTTSNVVVLEGEDRVEELARMLAGHADSASARDHARELMERSRLDASDSTKGTTHD